MRALAVLIRLALFGVLALLARIAVALVADRTGPLAIVEALAASVALGIMAAGLDLAGHGVECCLHRVRIWWIRRWIDKHIDMR